MSYTNSIGGDEDNTSSKAMLRIGAALHRNASACGPEFASLVRMIGTCFNVLSYGGKPENLRPEDLIELARQTAKALEEPVKAPRVDELLHFVSTVVEDVMETLNERGTQYGEESLVVLGESGIATMMRMKIDRVRSSINSGAPEHERIDSWRDLAGYALLWPALLRWQKAKRPSDAE